MQKVLKYVFALVCRRFCKLSQVFSTSKNPSVYHCILYYWLCISVLSYVGFLDYEKKPSEVADLNLRESLHKLLWTIVFLTCLWKQEVPCLSTRKVLPENSEKQPRNFVKSLSYEVIFLEHKIFKRLHWFTNIFLCMLSQILNKKVCNFISKYSFSQYQINL